MKNNILLNLSLALHLAGLSISMGIVFTKYMYFRKVFSPHTFDAKNWTLALSTTGRLNPFLGIGMGVAILSGMSMMYLAYSAFMQQIWFQLKIGTIVLIIAAGIFAIRYEATIRKSLSKDEMHSQSLLPGKLKFFVGLQLAFFFVIIFLATFRF